MRNSLRVLPVLMIPALALGVASPAFAAAPSALSTNSGSGLLASTGADVTAWIIAAIVFLGVGALLFFVAQRQRVKARANEAALAAALESNEAAEAVAATDTDNAFVDASGAVDAPDAAPNAAPDAAADAPETPDASGAEGDARGGDTPA